MDIRSKISGEGKCISIGEKQFMSLENVIKQSGVDRFDFIHFLNCKERYKRIKKDCEVVQMTFETDGIRRLRIQKRLRRKATLMVRAITLSTPPSR